MTFDSSVAKFMLLFWMFVNQEALVKFDLPENRHLGENE